MADIGRLYQFDPGSYLLFEAYVAPFLASLRRLTLVMLTLCSACPSNTKHRRECPWIDLFSNTAAASLLLRPVRR